MTEPVASSGRRWSRRGWLGVAGMSAAVGAGVAWRRFQPRVITDEAVQRLWDMAFQKPQGGVVRLADWRGRFLVVNFWATWCPPCVDELPLLNAFYKAQRTNGWQVLGLAVDQPGAVDRFLKQLPLEFAVGIAGLSGVELSRSLGNANGGLPFTVVLGREGEVLSRKLGKLDASDLEAWLRY